MKKPAFYRILAISAIVVGALSFQNCGPTFVTDNQGQIQFSSFEGPVEIPNILPSKVRSDFPTGSRGASSLRLTAAPNGSGGLVLY